MESFTGIAAAECDEMLATDSCPDCDKNLFECECVSEVTPERAQEEALSVACMLLVHHKPFGSCADLAKALRDECEDQDVSPEAKKLLVDEIGIGF